MLSMEAVQAARRRRPNFRNRFNPIAADAVHIDFAGDWHGRVSGELQELLPINGNENLFIPFAAAPVETSMQLREWLLVQRWHWPHRDRSGHSRYISRAMVVSSRRRLRCCG